ncbi:MAG: amino acid decarboxylase, partial [bacterium]
LSTICFRAIPESLSTGKRDAFNEALLEAINDTGETFLSHTRLLDRFTLRLAIGNLKTRRDHLTRVKQLLVTKAHALKKDME